MFNTFSKGGIATWVLVIEGALKLFDIEAPEGSVTSIVNGIVSLIALGLLVWSTFSRDDLTLGIIRN